MKYLVKITSHYTVFFAKNEAEAIGKAYMAYKTREPENLEVEVTPAKEKCEPWEQTTGITCPRCHTPMLGNAGIKQTYKCPIDAANDKFLCVACAHKFKRYDGTPYENKPVDLDKRFAKPKE